MVIPVGVEPQQAPPSAGAMLIDAAELERRRLERELHDHAEQRLLGLSHQLSALSARAAPGSAEASAISAARGELDAALRELRELVRSLHPSALGRHGLHVAVNALAARSPVPVTVTVDVPERPPAVVEIAAYYLVSDALANTTRHAGASTATVVIRSEDGELLVEVADDGRGGADPAAGTGLRGLADRIAGLGGSLEVTSPPGRGTTLRARIPAPPASATAGLAA